MCCVSMMILGLGVISGEELFFHKMERNYQEQTHRSEIKNEQKEHILKNIETILKSCMLIMCFSVLRLMETPWYSSPPFF